MKNMILFFLAVGFLSLNFAQRWEEKSCSSLSGSVYINRLTSISIYKALEWNPEDTLEYVSCVNYLVQYEIGGRAATYKLYFRFKNSQGVEGTYELYVYAWGDVVNVLSVNKLEEADEGNQPTPAPEEKKREYPNQPENSWLNINCNALNSNEKAAYDFAVKELDKKYGSMGLTSLGCFSSQAMEAAEGVSYKFQLDYKIWLASTTKRFVILVLRNQSGNFELKSLDYIRNLME